MKGDANRVMPEPAITNEAVNLLREAASIIGSRAVERDVEQERSMADIVRTFNAYTGHTISETEGWAFMLILKMVRSQRGKYKEDDFIDMAAYAALMGESRQMDDIS